MPDEVNIALHEEMILRRLLVFICLVLTCTVAHAETATFTFLKTVTVSELNAILSAEREEFIKTTSRGDGYELPAASTASNDVDLFVVKYHSQSMDLANQKRMMASGLLALPRLSNLNSVRLLSYQHGTVWGKYEVPSYSFRTSNPGGYAHYDNAYETRHMVGLFAGNGYAVMAADYLGMGDGSQDNEAYMMKLSTAQVNYDLYLDVREYLGSRGVDIAKFFLGGWSQGGLNTTGFLELLESRGVPVSAAFTAASPNDPFASLNGTFYHPRANDAPWINTILALTIFSCENYFGPKGLAKATIAPDYYNGFQTIYDRNSYPTNLLALLDKWAKTPNLDYLRPEFRDPAFFASSAYGQCLAMNETYRQEFRTITRMFYGSNDEVIRERTGRLGAEYQETLVATPDAPSPNSITPILVKGGDHRLTFITAASAAKTWFNGMP